MKKFQALMKSRFENAKKNNKGFSLVELIIAVVILGIIAVVAIGGLYGNVTKSRVNTDISNAQSIQSALSTLAADKEVYNLAKTQKEGTTLYELTWTGSEDTAVTIVSGDKISGKDACSKAITNILTDGLPKAKAGGAFKLTIKCTGTDTSKDSNGNVTITCKAYKEPACTTELTAAE